MKAFPKSTQLTLGLFAIYLIALYWIIVLKFNIGAYHAGVERSINWIPFREYVLYGILNLPELILNVLIFIPFGLYAGVIFRQLSFGKKVILFFGISFFFEISQYILKVGACDMTDLITNTLGGLIGLLIYLWLKRVFGGRPKAQNFVNIFAFIGTILIFSLLFYLKLNDLWIFRMQLLK